jgi:hypothetical protein
MFYTVILMNIAIAILLKNILKLSLINELNSHMYNGHEPS